MHYVAWHVGYIVSLYNSGVGALQRTKRRTTKELQDLDPLSSPHLEERWIGGNVDLDLLSLFPQRYPRIMGGIERGASFPRSTMVGERGENVLGEAINPLGKKWSLL